MVPPRWRCWQQSNGVGEEGREDEGDALKGEGERGGGGELVAVAAVPLRPPFPVSAKPRLDRTRRTMVAGREDEPDATLFLLGFLRLPRDASAASSAGLILLYHAALLAFGGFCSGRM